MMSVRKIPGIVFPLCFALVFHCSVIHPPLSVESHNTTPVNRRQIKTLLSTYANQDTVLPNSVGVIPFYENNSNTGLGLAATEFFTANLGLFEQFELVDMSYSTILEQEFNAFSPLEQIRSLRAEKIVTGIVMLKNRQILMAGFDMQRSDPSYEKLSVRKGDGTEFFRLVSDLNIKFLEKNGITVTPEIADQLYRIPTENLQAYVLYAKGRHEEYLGNYQTALSAYENASRLDPSFTKARQAASQINNRLAALPRPVLEQKMKDIRDDRERQNPGLEERFMPPLLDNGTVVIDIKAPTVERINPGPTVPGVSLK
ncbi:MAG: tetratricopeptide repeat protein [candidate division KSB1 bacterium]|nr:tetratricopeptide repeat protein [candidate division KSB1 bacterium]